jgi:hypothetical protein
MVSHADFFSIVLGLNLGLHVCKVGALLLEPHLQYILLWLFWGWGLVNYLSGLALNLDPISASQVTRIIGVSHQHLAHAEFYVVNKTDFWALSLMG